MTREEKFPWFFDSPWENVEKLLSNVGTKESMVKALKDIHSGSQYVSAKKYGISKQSVYQWFATKDEAIKKRRISIG